MKKYLILIFVALAAVFQSCDNNDDLWDAIDDLKSRVQALETQVDALNGNIEALQKLYGGATISKVETSDGKYVVTLTNGETIELVQGSEAVAVIPIVSINDKGEWQVSTDNGATFTSLGVKAVAEDGTTPRFRIDEATGYWQVSYDGGTSFENVKDTKGQPVKAIGSGTVTDKFFEEVKVDGGDLYIRLLGGEELRIPIVSVQSWQQSQRRFHDPFVLDYAEQCRAEFHLADGRRDVCFELVRTMERMAGRELRGLTIPYESDSLEAMEELMRESSELGR